MDFGYFLVGGAVIAYVGYRFGVGRGYRWATEDQGLALWQFLDTLPVADRLDLKQKIREHNKKLAESRELV